MKLSGPTSPFISVKHRPYNLPFIRRIKKQMRRLKPDDSCQDPYIAALLIRLGQAKRLNRNSGKPIDTADVTPHSLVSPTPRTMLLVTDAHNKLSLHVYTSDVPSGFLDRLDNPSSHVPADAESPLGITAEQWQLAYQSYEMLQERLAAVVGGF